MPLYAAFDSFPLPPLPTAEELARLFGVREEDGPNGYIAVSNDRARINQLNHAVAGAQRSPSVQAEFLSIYLPALLKILQDVPITSPMASEILFTFYGASGFPPFTRALHRLVEARNLPSLLVRSFVSYPLDHLDNLPPPRPGSINNAWFPCRDLIVLQDLIDHSVNYGPATYCNFTLDASLLADFSRVGTHFLSTTFLQEARASNDNGDYAPILKSQITIMLAKFGLGPTDDPSIAAIRDLMRECGRGRDQADVAERFWCELDKEGCCDKGSEMKVSAKCLSVAYCSVDHQRKHWKKHKLVCFKPSWLVERGRVGGC